MNIEEVRTFCLSMPETTEDMPFGDDTVVFKTSGKIFCLMPLFQNPPRINLKCNPEEAEALREKFMCVTPGYHMNKKYWNTITFDGTLSDALIKLWITDSYNIIRRSLPKKTTKK